VSTAGLLVVGPQMVFGDEWVIDNVSFVNITVVDHVNLADEQCTYPIKD
jgi:hypothetical protein